MAPRGRATRPTSDRVREALFSILGDVSDERVLDLYAGSGALGLEALSRGAASAVLVDSGATAFAAISRNLAVLGAEAVVVRRDALAFLRAARQERREYDLVFIDPPYARASSLRTALSDALPAVLSTTARLVAESDRREPLGLDLPLIDERTYGDTLIQIHSNDPR